MIKGRDCNILPTISWILMISQFIYVEGSHYVIYIYIPLVRNQEIPSNPIYPTQCRKTPFRTPITFNLGTEVVL